MPTALSLLSRGNGFALSQLAQTLNIDFNTLQKCCCDVQAAIQQVAGQVGFSAERVINAVNLGDCNVIQALQNCCCQTQRQIADFRADIQLQNCKDTGELVMVSVILALQLHKVSQLLLSRLSKISVIFFAPVRTILSVSSTL